MYRTNGGRRRGGGWSVPWNIPQLFQCHTEGCDVHHVTRIGKENVLGRIHGVAPPPKTTTTTSTTTTHHHQSIKISSIATLQSSELSPSRNLSRGPSVTYGLFLTNGYFYIGTYPTIGGGLHSGRRTGGYRGTQHHTHHPRGNTVRTGWHVWNHHQSKPYQIIQHHHYHQQQQQQPTTNTNKSYPTRSNTKRLPTQRVTYGIW